MSQSKDTPSTRASFSATRAPTFDLSPDSIIEECPADRPDNLSSSRALIPPSSRASLRRLPIPRAPNLPTAKACSMTTTVVATTAIVNTTPEDERKPDDTRSQTAQNFSMNRPSQWRTLKGRLEWVVRYVGAKEGWTGRRLSEQAGLSSSYGTDLARRVGDGSNTKLSTVYAIADAAAVSAGWLVDNEGWPSSDVEIVYRQGGAFPWDSSAESTEDQSRAMAEMRRARLEKAKASTAVPKLIRKRRPHDSEIRSASSNAPRAAAPGKRHR